MRRHSEVPNPYQVTFQFEEMWLPSKGTHEVNEATLPSLTTTSEFLPVYTVFLRRSNVVTMQDRPVIRSPQDVEVLVREVLTETDREHFLVLLLDTKNKVIGVNVVSVGILDSALVHPREVYKPAILANAASIILAHNHPSGDPSPSAEDRRITQRIYEAGQILGIEVLDHIIIGDNHRFVSLKERGVL